MSAQIVERRNVEVKINMVHPANEYLVSGFSCPEGGLPKTKGLIKSAPGQSRASWDATLGMNAHKAIF